MLMGLTVLSWMLGSCVRPTHGDACLVTADSLLRHHPDSALSLLTGLDERQLGSEADRAYYALLLTQARYSCYVVATSDSLINTALDYYTRHRKDQEKLTRSYIYKGAVMEELGEKDSAMTYFKLAKEMVPPDDYFNQGYVRLRIGNLYRNQIIADSADIMMFKEALRYFKMVPDSFYVLTCLAEIGSSYSKNNRDSVMPYLNQADALARSLNARDLQQINSIYIAEHKMFSQDSRDVDAAKQIALSLMKDKSDYQGEVMMIAAYTLARQHKADSAQFFMNKVNIASLSSPIDLMLYYMCLAETALAQGDTNQYRLYDEMADNITDSLRANAVQLKLREVEASYDNEVLKNENLRYRTMVASLIAAALALTGILSLAILLLRRRKRQLRDREDDLEHLRGDRAQLASQLQANQTMNEGLKQTIRNQIDSFSALVEEHEKLYTNKPQQFNELFRNSYNAKQPDGSFWTGIQSYADSISGGLISHAQTVCPELTDSDLRFLCLYVCDLPTLVIMICLGYGNVRSMYNKKRRVAELLTPTGNLDEYIMDWRQQYGC